MPEYKQVPLLDHVTVSVKELHKLREDRTLLKALKLVGVEKWLFNHDPDIRNIELG